MKHLLLSCLLTITASAFAGTPIQGRPLAGYCKIQYWGSMSTVMNENHSVLKMYYQDSDVLFGELHLKGAYQDNGAFKKGFFESVEGERRTDLSIEKEIPDNKDFARISGIIFPRRVDGPLPIVCELKIAEF